MISHQIALYGNADLLIWYLLIAEHRVTSHNQAFTIKCNVINPIKFSLEQNISRLFRQAFIHCCELHQVCKQPSITVITLLLLGLSEHMLCIQSILRKSYDNLWMPIGWIGLGLTIIVYVH